jgi:hypothetical protein
MPRYGSTEISIKARTSCDQSFGTRSNAFIICDTALSPSKGFKGPQFVRNGQEMRFTWP